MADELGDTDELSLEELEAQVARQLPDREAMSLLSPDPVAEMGAFGDVQIDEGESGEEAEPGSAKLPEQT